MMNDEYRDKYMKYTGIHPWFYLPHSSFCIHHYSYLSASTGCKPAARLAG